MILPETGDFDRCCVPAFQIFSGLLFERGWQAAGLTEESLLFSDAVPYAPITSLGTRFEMPQMIS